MSRHFLVASDFDQTLSFNDSGYVLSQMLGIDDFDSKVKGLACSHLVQQGAELTYLLRHDPAFRSVRAEDLAEAGRQVRLKANIKEFAEFLERGTDDCRFSFYVVSAAPREVVSAALEGLIPADHVFGTELDYDQNGEICAVKKVTAGNGKVVVLEELETALGIRPDRVVYVGDGSSDLHVMQHVNHREGLTISVSESQQVTRTAHRTVLSDNALSVLVPILEDVAGWQPSRIRDLFEPYGLVLQGWDRARTDWLTIAHSRRSVDLEAV